MQAAAQELPRTRSSKVFGKEAAHYEDEIITKTKTTRKSSRDIRKSKKRVASRRRLNLHWKMFLLAISLRTVELEPWFDTGDFYQRNGSDGPQHFEKYRVIKLKQECLSL